MAPQRVVKSLNKGPGKKRFVFKSFAQRVEEVDVDVFRSLAPLKYEPTSGSSFFHENLLRWRELNAAADFNAVYVELLPIVQTLPQLLLHKDLVMKSLLSRVRMSALLSMEPILSLIAILSRDLREDFLPYLGKFLETCSDLLKTGGDQDPDVLEQVFVSISYVIKYLMKVLAKDILFILRVTKSLRYYHRTFVQDFISESISYLLRKASLKQLIKGVRRLFTEVEADSSETTSSSTCTLLFHTLKGPAFGLHSQAKSLLHLLLDRSTLSGVQKKRHGDDKEVAVQVVSRTLLMLCEHIKREKLEVLWICLIEQISGELQGHSSPTFAWAGPQAMMEDNEPPAVKKLLIQCDSDVQLAAFEGDLTVQEKSLSDPGGPGPPCLIPKEMPEVAEVRLNELQVESGQMHLVHLLFIITNILEFRNGNSVNDFKPLFELVPKLLQPDVISAKKLELVHHSPGPMALLRLFQDETSVYLSEIFRFLLALVKSHAQVAGASAGPGYIASVAPRWAVAFHCSRVNCLLPFLKGLVEQDVSLLRIFAPDILRSLDRLIEDYPVDVLPLLLDTCQKLESVAILLSNLHITKLKSYVFCLIQEAIKGLQSDSFKPECAGYIETLVLDPAVLWVALKCLPFIVSVHEEQASLAWKYAVAVEQVISGKEVGVTEESTDISTALEFLLATALSSHTKLLIKGEPHGLQQHINKYLDLAAKHTKSSKILNAVGELLDASRQDIALDYGSLILSPHLQDFASNLSAPLKSLRIGTLRILSYFNFLQGLRHDSDQSSSKCQEGKSGHVNSRDGLPFCESFQQLLLVESAPLSHENFRQSSMLVTAVKVAACAKEMPELFLVLVFNAFIGLLHNRFSLLWDSVMDALAAILEAHGSIVGQVLLCHLQATQHSFLYKETDDGNKEIHEDLEGESRDLWTRYASILHDNIEGTQGGTLLTLQLKVLQTVPSFSEARSRQLIPLFVQFVGHSDSSEGSCVPALRSGKEWRAALKDWLVLIKEMRNARSLFQGSIVKEILLRRFLPDSDPAIQQITLEALLNWKDKYLTTNEEHLKNLISSKALREELTTWDVSKEGQLIEEADRAPLLTALLLILFPKIMRRTTKSMGKLGMGVRRNAVLSFLARLESKELAPFFVQLMEPLQSAFSDSNPAGGLQRTAWVSIVEEGVPPQFIEQVGRKAVTILPFKRKLGFLHMVIDSLEIFNSSQLEPYLYALLGLVLRLLETCTITSKDYSSACDTRNWFCDVKPAAERESNIRCDFQRTSAIQVENGKGRITSLGLGDIVFLEDTKPADPSNVFAESIDLGTVQQPSSQSADIAMNSVESLSVEWKEQDTGFGSLETERSKAVVTVVDGEVPLSVEKLQQGDYDQVLDSGLSEDREMSTPKRDGGVREIRTLCYRIFATVIRKFETLVFPPQYWEIFFRAIKHSVSRFVDENSFTSGPSALMQCFLAMSQRLELAPLLAKDPILVPNVLLILAVKGASAEVISAVLKFVENMLDLMSGSGEDEEMGAVEGILCSHLDVLLSSFGRCLSFNRETASQRRSLKRELKILTRLTKYIVDTSVAEKLQDVLLPMLRVRKRMEQELCVDVLHLLQGIGPILQSPSIIKCLHVLAPLLAVVGALDIRIAVCGTLMALAKVQGSLLKVAELIRDLNSMSSSTINEFDYGRRLFAYDCITESLFLQLTKAEALLVLSHVIYDMGSEDLSIRHRASDCLQKYVRFAASLPSDNLEKVLNSRMDVHACGPEKISYEDVHLIPAIVEGNDPSESFSVQALKCLVPDFLLPHVRHAMGSDLLIVRREWVLLLREMAANFSSGAALQEYHCLISNDLEADFFHNIVHLQVHRRIKAMAKFKVICSSSHFSQGALSRIFVPLFMNSLFEARGDKEGNLVTVAVETLACIAAQLTWDPYFGLLMRCFRLLGSKPDHQKVLVRLVCAILDAFHFFLPHHGDFNEEADADIKMEDPECLPSKQCRILSLPEDAKRQRTSDSRMVGQLSTEVVSLLWKRVLPEIRRLMVSKAGIVSTSVALTQVKILKLMPANVVEVELPQVVQTVINALKSRSQAVRDEARAALVAISETLGANYIHFIVDMLRSSLTKGFELHVLGYTLNAILVKVVPRLSVGEIDYCLERLLEILENDIMGEVAEEKNVEAIALKMKETRHMRSFESFKLLAQVVTFRTQVTALLSPVRRNLYKSLVPFVKQKLENILQHIALGLQQNVSVRQSDLLVIVYAMVEDGLKEEKAMRAVAAARKQARIDKLASTNTLSGDSLQASKTPSPHFYLIMEFALQLLHNHLRRVKVSAHDEDTLAMLNPLVGLLQECLNSKFDGVLASALKTLGLLLLLPLPAVDLYGSKITALVFSICQRFAKAENSLLQACLSVLMILIRKCKSLRLSENQLRALLQFPIFSDMGDGSRMALSLLKSIVARKLLVPELYDMINRVAQLMVTSYAGPVRQLCSQIMLQFLLDYPLGKKRLQQHLDFFITNVGYAEESGREAALDMLHTVILKFPQPVVEEHAASMFFTLVTRLVNDESNQVRSMIGTILKVLMGRVAPHSLQRMVDLCLSWYNGADLRLCRTAAQVLGFLIQVMSTSFARYTQDIFPQCIKILELASSPHDSELTETGKAVQWQDVYFSMTMMEKFLQQLPNYILLPDLKKFWVLVSSLLLHQHLWIRKSCGRLLSIYFAACEVPSSQRLESAGLGKEDILFFHPSWVLLLAASLCQQLDSDGIDEAMGELVLKLLEIISSLLPLLPQSISVGPRGKLSFLGCDYEDTRERVSRALLLLGWKDSIENDLGESGKEIIPVVEVAENGEHDQRLVGDITALSLVFKKLQRIALRLHPVQTKVILRWYASIASKLSSTDVEQYFPSMLVVLIKISEGGAGKVVPEDVRNVGEEVLNHLRELVGAAKFVNMYNAVRETGKVNREKRKHARKISVLVDPERNAKRKIKLAVKRQAQKKRKIIRTKAEMGL